MHGEHQAFLWLNKIPGLENVPNHISTTIFLFVLLIALGSLATLKLRSAGESAIIPDGTLTYRNFFDLLAERLYSLCEHVLGPEGAKEFFPVIGTLFIFVFSCNLIGLIPGFLPPSENINVTLAAGVFVFLYYNFTGFKEHGISYIKQLFGPVWYLAPLLFLVELLSHLFRPVTLALRLKGNIMGDHIILATFHHLVPFILPVIFYVLGLFVAFVQAFVFSLLTMVYLSLATSHDH